MVKIPPGDFNLIIGPDAPWGLEAKKVTEKLLATLKNNSISVKVNNRRRKVARKIKGQKMKHKSRSDG